MGGRGPLMAVFVAPTLRDGAERSSARYPAGRERSALMPLLYLVQSVEGWVTREGLREVADLLGLTHRRGRGRRHLLHDAAAAPDGRARGLGVHEPVVRAARCERRLRARARGGRRSRTASELSEDGLITLHEEECLGACEWRRSCRSTSSYHDRDARADALS